MLKPLAGTGKVFCYDSPEYVRDMGTPERYKMVTKDFKSGKVVDRNLRYKQKAIFLDRDGTINKYIGFLRDVKEFELLDGPDVAKGTMVLPVKSLASKNVLTMVGAVYHQMGKPTYTTSY